MQMASIWHKKSRVHNEFVQKRWISNLPFLNNSGNDLTNICQFCFYFFFQLDCISCQTGVIYFQVSIMQFDLQVQI